MSLDKYVGDVVRTEVQRVVAPLAGSLAALEAQMARMAQAFGGAAPLKRGPGRPPKAASVVAASLGKKPGKRGPKAADGEKRACAIIDCDAAARSKGYCAAHYQKFRMLQKTDRLPAAWVADAAPGSVENIVLPRGRAGAKALADAKKK